MRRGLLALAAVLAVALIGPATSQAWVQIGGCQLHVENLFVIGSPGTESAQGGGWINNCDHSYGYYKGDQTICIQVRTQTGSFVDIKTPNTCDHTTYLSVPNQSPSEWYTECDGCGTAFFRLTPGHVYRTADHASLRDPGGSQWNQSYYQSPAITAQ